MSASTLVGAILVALILAMPGLSQPAPTPRPEAYARTLFAGCQENGSPKRLLSEVALSEDATRLWVARAHKEYRLLYLIPPTRTAAGNGMEILGWARKSSMLLAKTEERQEGSDAPVRSRVIAVDAGSGLVYEADLGAMLASRRDRQCGFRITDAGFSGDESVKILVRAQFYTATEVDEREEDVAPEKRCGHGEETWGFNFATGEIRQVKSSQPLQLFRKSVPNGRDR